jgi:hypothetical protein
VTTGKTAQLPTDRRRSTRAKVVAGTLALGALGALFACLEATQITVDLATDTSVCTAGRTRFTLRVGSPGTDLRSLDADVRQYDGAVTECPVDLGTASIGTFAITPKDSDARTSGQKIEVALRTSGDPSLCDDRDAEAYRKDKTCILVRRRISFVPHKGLLLPAYFDDRCLGVPCEEDQSCFRGKCVDATVTCDADGVCRIPAERLAQSAYRDPARPVGGVVNDAGVLVFPDGATTSTDGASTTPDGSPLDPDSASTDGSSSSDASFPDGNSTDSAVTPDTSLPDSGTFVDAAADGGLSGGVDFNCTRCTGTATPTCCGNATLTMFTCKAMCGPGENVCNGAARACMPQAIE